MKKEGLNYPSIDQLTKKYTSKYEIAFVAGKVGKYIRFNKDYVKDGVNHEQTSPVGQALEDILEDKVKTNKDNE